MKGLKAAEASETFMASTLLRNQGQLAAGCFGNCPGVLTSVSDSDGLSCLLAHSKQRLTLLLGACGKYWSWAHPWEACTD